MTEHKITLTIDSEEFVEMCKARFETKHPNSLEKWLVNYFLHRAEETWEVNHSVHYLVDNFVSFNENGKLKEFVTDDWQDTSHHEREEIFKHWDDLGYTFIDVAENRIDYTILDEEAFINLKDGDIYLVNQDYCL